MNFQLNNYSCFADLPLEYLDKLDYSVYVIDFSWNYLFVNQFVYNNLNVVEDLTGKHMWEVFPLLAMDPDFQKMRRDMEAKGKTNLVAVSPLTSKRVSIMGYALKDCYFFSMSIMLNKEDFITDLRKHMEKVREPQ